MDAAKGPYSARAATNCAYLAQLILRCNMNSRNAQTSSVLAPAYWRLHVDFLRQRYTCQQLQNFLQLRLWQLAGSEDCGQRGPCSMVGL